MKQTFTLTGLDCASCALAIESALDHVDGVQDCEVKDRENLLHVEFDETKVRSEQILEAGRDAGFDAEA